MYFPFFELKKWGKKMDETRRHNYAVLPYVNNVTAAHTPRSDGLPVFGFHGNQKCFQNILGKLLLKRCAVPQDRGKTVLLLVFSKEDIVGRKLQDGGNTAQSRDGHALFSQLNVRAELWCNVQHFGEGFPRITESLPLTANPCANFYPVHSSTSKKLPVG